jgi:hypothetical protein
MSAAHDWSQFCESAKSFLSWSNRFKGALISGNCFVRRELKRELKDVFQKFYDSSSAALAVLVKKFEKVKDLPVASMEAAVSDDEITLAHYLLDLTRNFSPFKMLGLKEGEAISFECDLKEVVRIGLALSQKHG